MNGMNFKPFISKVLDSLSDENLSSLASLIDSHSNNFSYRSLIDSNNLLTSSDKGVGLFTIQLDEHTIRTGYLLYNNSYCVLLSYVSNSERVAEYQINLSNMKAEMVKEYLTTDYFRHEVAIRANGAADSKVIIDSLLDGELKTVLQNKSLSVSDFPLTSDIDNQHDVVNEGKLPNGDMENLTESDIAKLTLTLNRIINKGWLKTSSSNAIRISSVLYSDAGIFVVASNIVFTSTNTLSNGSSYKIFLDPANATYEYTAGSYSSNS